MFRLKKLRTEKNISLRELSNQIDISYSSLGKYEREEQEPNIQNLIKISDFFDVSIDYLVGKTNCKDQGNVKISATTGLSEKSIDLLKRLNSIKKTNIVNEPTVIEAIDYILSDELALPFLTAIYCYMELNVAEDQDNRLFAQPNGKLLVAPSVVSGIEIFSQYLPQTLLFEIESHLKEFRKSFQQRNTNKSS